MWSAAFAPAASDFFVYTDKTWANISKFRHLHLHHCVRLPHHSLENCRTFQDLLSKFPGLSRAWKFYKKKSGTFHDFPGGVGTVFCTIQQMSVYTKPAFASRTSSLLTCGVSCCCWSCWLSCICRCFSLSSSFAFITITENCSSEICGRSSHSYRQFHSCSTLRT